MSFTTPPVSSRSKNDVLSVAEEIRLIEAWRERGETRARDRLIASHRPLVLKAASRFRGYNLSAEDLVAEGNVGLMRALEGFEPERGLRFATYARWWVRAAMYEYVLKFSSPLSVGLSADRKRIFFKLRSLKTALMGPGKRSFGPEEAQAIATKLDVNPKSVLEMEKLLCQRPRSLDAPVTAEGDVRYGDLLADTRPDQETVLGERQERARLRSLLASCWRKLTERERNILTERLLKETPLRLEDLAVRHGVSRERIRQIEAAALKKLKAFMLAPVPAPAGA